MKPETIKKDVMHDLGIGHTVSNISKRYGLSRATIYAWKKSAKRLRAPVKAAAAARKEYGEEVVTTFPKMKMYPTSAEQLETLNKRCEQLESQYGELLQISKEELTNAKAAVDMLLEMLKLAVTERFRPRAGGTPDYVEKDLLPR